MRGQVKCEECRHYIDEFDAQKVTISSFLENDKSEWYCPMHTRPYSRKLIHLLSPITRYFSEFEVEEDGTPKGYTKAK